LIGLPPTAVSRHASRHILWRGGEWRERFYGAMDRVGSSDRGGVP
jgi:hypothetical protein